MPYLYLDPAVRFHLTKMFRRYNVGVGPASSVFGIRAAGASMAQGARAGQNHLRNSSRAAALTQWPARRYAMPIGEVCNREVAVIEADTTISEAVKLMRDQHVGDIVVVEQRGPEPVPVGILTDRDIVIEVLAEDVDPQSISVGDIMSASLLTARESEELIDVIARMRAQGVRRVPVVNERGGLEGILTVDDILELLAEQVNGLAGLVKTEQRRERERRTLP